MCVLRTTLHGLLLITLSRVQYAAAQRHSALKSYCIATRVRRAEQWRLPSAEVWQRVRYSLPYLY